MLPGNEYRELAESLIKAGFVDGTARYLVREDEELVDYGICLVNIGLRRYYRWNEAYDQWWATVAAEAAGRPLSPPALQPTTCGYSFETPLPSEQYRHPLEGESRVGDNTVDLHHGQVRSMARRRHSQERKSRFNAGQQWSSPARTQLSTTTNENTGRPRTTLLSVGRAAGSHRAHSDPRRLSAAEISSIDAISPSCKHIRKGSCKGPSPPRSKRVSIAHSNEIVECLKRLFLYANKLILSIGTPQDDNYVTLQVGRIKKIQLACRLCLCTQKGTQNHTYIQVLMCEEIKRQGQIIYGILKKQGWKYWQEEELLLRMKLQTLPRKHGSDFSMGAVHLQRACQHIYTALVTARQTEQQYDIVLGRVARQLARNIVASNGDGNIEEGVMNTPDETDSVALSDDIQDLQPEHYHQYLVEENPDDFAHSHAAYTKDDSGDSRSNFVNFEEEGDLLAHPERALLLSPKITSQSDEFTMTSVLAEQVIESLIELFQYACELQTCPQIHSDIPEKTKSLEQKILSVLEEAGYAEWDVEQIMNLRLVRLLPSKKNEMAFGAENLGGRRICLYRACTNISKHLRGEKTDIAGRHGKMARLLAEAIITARHIKNSSAKPKGQQFRTSLTAALQALQSNSSLFPNQEFSIGSLSGNSSDTAHPPNVSITGSFAQRPPSVSECLRNAECYLHHNALKENQCTTTPTGFFVPSGGDLSRDVHRPTADLLGYNHINPAGDGLSPHRVPDQDGETSSLRETRHTNLAIFGCPPTLSHEQFTPYPANEMMMLAPTEPMYISTTYDPSASGQPISTPVRGGSLYSFWANVGSGNGSYSTQSQTVFRQPDSQLPTDPLEFEGFHSTNMDMRSFRQPPATSYGDHEYSLYQRGWY